MRQKKRTLRLNKNTQVNGYTILCVDDEPKVVDAIARHLRRFDVRVLQALHGLQGISLALKEKPDLIITDICMPLANGEDLIDCISTNQSLAGIPIIALTGVQDSGITKRLTELGASSVVFKPYDVELLIEEIGKWIPMKQRQVLKNS